jgi:hypothetical protein
LQLGRTRRLFGKLSLKERDTGAFHQERQRNENKHRLKLGGAVVGFLPRHETR